MYKRSSCGFFNLGYNIVGLAYFMLYYNIISDIIWYYSKHCIITHCMFQYLNKFVFMYITAP